MTWARRTIVSFVLFLITVGLFPIAGGSADGLRADTTWTVMVYMADDTSSPLPWEDNINSMEAATQAPGTSILALVDLPGIGNSQILKITHDPNPQSATIVSPAIDDGGAVIPPADHEVNMASAATLQAFITFAVERYPAARTMLVLWGHGDGWRGLCPDGSDLLTLPELGSALASATAAMGRGLDIVAVDSCAGATFEMLYELSGHSDFLVASENNVPFQGLPYTQILNGLAAETGQSAERFCSEIVRDYIESAWTGSPYSTTMAAFNLASMQLVFDHLSTLASTGSKYERIFHSALNDALASAEHYDTEWYVDFGDFMDELQGQDQMPLEIRTLAIETALAYDASIASFAKFDNPDPADGIHVAHASGAVIYAPSGGFPDVPYEALGIAGTPWYNFSVASRRTAFTSDRVLGPTLSYADSSTDNDNLSDSVELIWPESHSSVEAWVFRLEPGGYVLCERVASTGQSIEVSDYLGHLLIAASASDGGVAVSYDELNVTLYGTGGITILVMRDGRLSQSDYDVRVTGSNYVRSSSASNGVLRMNISIPTDLAIGDMIIVEILDPGSDAVLGTRYVVVQPIDTFVEIDVFSQEGTGSGFILLAFFSILPGLLILLFAAMMYWDLVKKKRE
jgi:hypothetical protein